jgi:hypothetical protein
MNDYEKAIHDLKEALAKRRATLVQATILDQDNQPVATGTATPESEGALGTFWLFDAGLADTLTSRAAVLRRSDGTGGKFVRFERCPYAHFSMHFHFQIEA